MVASAHVRRVLVVIGADGPSGVVRGLVYEKKLEAEPYQGSFERLYFSPLTKLRKRAAAFGNALTKRLATAPVDLAIVGVRKLRERQVLARAHAFDAVMLVKYFSAAFVRALRSRTRAKLLYDFDDAMWLPEFLGKAAFEDVLGLVDAVSCDNAYLLDHVGSHRAKAFVLRGPAQAIVAAPRPAKAADEPVVIGWVGSHSTVHYLEIVKEPLARLARELRGRLRFRIVGSGYDKSRLPDIPGLAIETLPEYDEPEMRRQLGEIDIGLFPLHDDENSLGRGILKATLYMAASVPAVCSAVGELTTFIAHGENGYVCASADAWYEALLALTTDPLRRARVGEGGWQLVRREFSLDSCFAVLEREFLDRLG
jgi:glycosyltransferase involved in cell wall biosynthesis